jgi:hypothetical protein
MGAVIITQKQATSGTFNNYILIRMATHHQM